MGEQMPDLGPTNKSVPIIAGSCGTVSQDSIEEDSGEGERVIVIKRKRTVQEGCRFPGVVRKSREVIDKGTDHNARSGFTKSGHPYDKKRGGGNPIVRLGLKTASLAGFQRRGMWRDARQAR